MLSALAPGRVAVAFGTGFNGTRALSAPPATWSYLKSYVQPAGPDITGELERFITIAQQTVQS
jgi:5,10-methylenetetrahydromethanopterin reductase